MGQQPAEQENEMSTQDRQRLDQILAQIRESKATAPVRHGHVVVSPTGRLAHLPGI